MELDGREAPLPLETPLLPPAEDRGGGGDAGGEPGPALRPEEEEEEEEREEGAAGARSEEGGRSSERPETLTPSPCVLDLPLGPGALGTPLDSEAAKEPVAQASWPPRELPPPLPLPLPLPPRGKCLLGNWQEERATNALDQVPCPELGSEGFFFRHGHRGLLSLRFGAGLARGTTTHDSYRTPQRTGLPIRGQREAMLEWLLYQKHSKEVFAEQVQPPRGPMESESVMRRDFCRGSFVSVPPAPTKPHDYRLEQPQTFWVEHAQRVPGVSCIQKVDAPFRKCTAFTTPVPEYLEKPYNQETYPEF